MYKERIEVIVKMQKTVGGVRSGRGEGVRVEVYKELKLL